MPAPKRVGCPRSNLGSQDGWTSLMICRRQVDPVEVLHVQLRPAVRALLINLDGSLDALLAEDVTTDG